ncbi:MAG: histidinol-phosphate transaminase [Scytolyngbya sp. HA4215-MV1]|jgi:histidinol-phosphate aminotransferase|nr:histidinol-phosphate transaminase [Scytolyngbya sp. HA4215-MV1]
MLQFIRSDLAEFTAYTPHPSGVSESDAQSHGTIDHLDTNECPWDMPEELKQKLAWTYQQEILSNRYPDGGHLLLKQAIADYVNESANLAENSFNSDYISVGNGSDELIRSVLIATCLRGEGAVLVAEPTFSMYGILAATLGIPVFRVGRSLSNFEIDLVAARSLVESSSIEQPQTPSIRVVFMVHPNSPTGNALTNAELNWLRNLPEQILVVIDEAYFEFSQTTVVSELLQRPNWMVMRTFSKAFRLAAHRVGYAIAHPNFITALEKVRLPYNLPSFSQAATLSALFHRQELLSAIPQILAERTRLAESLRQMPALQVWASSANFIYVRLQSDNLDANTVLQAICQNLKAEGTLIRHTSDGLRLTIGTPEENDRLLERLKAATLLYAQS